MSLLHVTNKEWEYANAIFQSACPNGLQGKNFKIRRKDHASYLKHSFLCIDGKLVALKYGKYLGKGGFGKVKLCETQSGETFAVKIEHYDTPKSLEEKQSEHIIMSALGSFHGNITRERDDFAWDKTLKKYIKNKLYTLQPYYEGQALQSELAGNFFSSYSCRGNLNEFQRKQIALQTAFCIQNLHDKGIIHCDIKPANFMINIKKDMILISPIDFGFSKILGTQEKIYSSKIKGTRSYMAPEIAIYDEHIKSYTLPRGQSSSEYSKASDIYAFAMMLRNNLKLNFSWINDMLSTDPKQRPSIETVIKHLQNSLSIEQFSREEAIHARNTPYTTLGQHLHFLHQCRNLSQQYKDKKYELYLQSLKEKSPWRRTLESIAPACFYKVPESHSENNKLSAILFHLEAIQQSIETTRLPPLQYNEKILEKLQVLFDELTQIESRDSDPLTTLAIKDICNKLSEKLAINIMLQQRLLSNYFPEKPLKNRI